MDDNAIRTETETRDVGMAEMSAVNTVADEHSGGDAGQQGWIRQQRRCGTAAGDMWDYGDGKMG